VDLHRDDDGIELRRVVCLGFSDEEVEPGRSIAVEVLENGHPEEWDYDGWPVAAMLRLFDAHLAKQRPPQAVLDQVTAWATHCGHILSKIESAAREAEGEADAYVRDMVGEWKTEVRRYG